MTPETITTISDALKPLADKLGQGAGFVFQAYTVHAYAYGVASIIGGVLTLAGAGGGAWLAKRLWASHREAEKANRYYDDGFAVGTIVTGISTACVAAIAISLIADGVMHLIAPQYYAIHDLLCTVKSCQ